jgi:hypothetical protein
MKIKKKVMKNLKDQASQILYFEASMSDEDEAFKALKKRLVSIYKAGAKSVE